MITIIISRILWSYMLEPDFILLTNISNSCNMHYNLYRNIQKYLYAD